MVIDLFYDIVILGALEALTTSGRWHIQTLWKRERFASGIRLPYSTSMGRICPFDEVKLLIMLPGNGYGVAIVVIHDVDVQMVFPVGALFISQHV